MLKTQKDLFCLEDNITYLNGAYMAPQLQSVQQVGIENLQKKAKPYLISEQDFFSEKLVLKKRFAQLIDAEDYQSTAIIPSVSYGIAIVAKNIPFQKGDEILVLEEQFPSNYYTWKALEKEKGVNVIVIKTPTTTLGRGKRWNEAILEAITSKTKVVAMPQVHWADGTWFDLKAIRKRTNEVEAYLIIDGTQSIGAMPFSVSQINPDALICGGYKWLMGPYGLGMAYFGKRFDTGIPIENNWMNHEGVDNFSNLVNYNQNFKPKATRYDVGESSNFILTPMLSEAIRQLIEWTPEAVQHYCQKITEKPLKTLQDLDCFIEEPEFRGAHLFGIYLSKEQSIQKIKNRLSEKKIFVSYRGGAIRVSPNVYNTTEDVEKLVSCFI
ncbi:MAG: aminotransferase class V [Flavobacteriaceae bacterium CG2_30_34_30]|nr:MAG: aminotransferase class V [Flavobacteriaceae bacterium CG2_30_34_30]PIV49749.1 MAG: aminotransferase [Flavobacteriaceae bacterium CG02_land_8_20_14_3_00_34_13]